MEHIGNVKTCQNFLEPKYEIKILLMQKTGRTVPNTTYFDSINLTNRISAVFTGTDADTVRQIQHKDLSVSDLTGSG